MEKADRNGSALWPVMRSSIFSRPTRLCPAPFWACWNRMPSGRSPVRWGAAPVRGRPWRARGWLLPFPGRPRSSASGSTTSITRRNRTCRCPNTRCCSPRPPLPWSVPATTWCCRPKASRWTTRWNSPWSSGRPRRPSPKRTPTITSPGTPWPTTSAPATSSSGSSSGTRAKATTRSVPWGRG